MVLTRQQSIAVFEHMREHFLHANDPDNPTLQALENSGISDMLDLLTMPLSLVDRFKYVQAPDPGETAGPPQPLNDGRKTLVQLLIKWCISLIQANAGVMLTEDEWRALDPDDFNVYRLRTASSTLMASGSTPLTTLGATPGNPLSSKAQWTKLLPADFCENTTHVDTIWTIYPRATTTIKRNDKRKVSISEYALVL